MILNEDRSVLNVVPVGMQNSALVLKDEDDSSISTELGDLSGVCEANLTPAAVSIENSSDVIIGPVTQFHGPVTIYQNVTGSPVPIEENGSANCLNGKLVKSESTSSDGPLHAPEKASKNFFPFSKPLQYTGISLLVLIIIIIIATATILSLKSDSNNSLKPAPDEPYDQVDDTDNNLIPAGPGLIIKKSVWGGRAALNFTIPLKHPVNMVIISHTATPECKTFEACAKRLKSIQDYHVDKLKSPDIGYNFLIGGDGNAYVGRGWDIRNFHGDDNIGINFIGNYVYDYLTPQMINITHKLLDEGVKTGKLSKNYKLVAHNQTFATQSPGAHVYAVIKNWPHFDPTTYISANDNKKD